MTRITEASKKRAEHIVRTERPAPVDDGSITLNVEASGRSFSIKIPGDKRSAPVQMQPVAAEAPARKKARKATRVSREPVESSNDDDELEDMSDMVDVGDWGGKSDDMVDVGNW